MNCYILLFSLWVSTLPGNIVYFRSQTEDLTYIDNRWAREKPPSILYSLQRGLWKRDVYLPPSPSLVPIIADLVHYSCGCGSTPPSPMVGGHPEPRGNLFQRPTAMCCTHSQSIGGGEGGEGVQAPRPGPRRPERRRDTGDEEGDF